MSTKIHLDETAMSAADAVFLTSNNLTRAQQTRAAVRAYLMASGRSVIAPFQIAAEAIEQESSR